jgi:hypothetical protein
MMRGERGIYLRPGKYPKENIQDSENGENLKSRRSTVFGAFKDSAIILDAIRRLFLTKPSSNSSNVYLISSRF